MSDNTGKPSKLAVLLKGVLKLFFLAAVVVAFGVGYWLRGAPAPPSREQAPKAEAEEKRPMTWTCSMHPQIKLPKPGKCPICFMDLIPLQTERGGEEHPRRLVLSETAKLLAEVETAPVEKRFVEAEIRMVGKLDYDETRMETISARINGRLDRLFVEYAGIPIKKGEHLAEIYSPELLSTQQELLAAIQRAREMKDDEFHAAKRLAQSAVNASRRRLLLWGLLPEQIARIEKTGETSDHVTLYSPLSGIVIQKHLLEGSYVQEGTVIYSIADLSRLWARLDAYESDLVWVRYGQKVEITAEAYPGETFPGWISLIEPVLTEMTRTVKLRVTVDNADGRLKPNMFVHGLVRARLAQGGRVVAEQMVGKWICSMHPEVVKDSAGECPMCHMPLVTTESLGYVTANGSKEPPLVIPASAPLATGKRAVVYVAVPDQEKPTYEGREIVLGPRAGDYYIVDEGLKEGERVVVRGNFKIDSALQIEARPSMMSPPAREAPGVAPQGKGPSPPARDVPAEFHRQFSAEIGGYLAMQNALASDQLDAARAEVLKMQTALEKVDMKLLDGEAHTIWMEELKNLSAALKACSEAKTIEAMREGFALLSDGLTGTIRRLSHAEKAPLIRFKCPMAFNGRGAWWLQVAPELRNPYFGGAMLLCGEKVEEFAPARQEK
ncbi:MAG: efflux RND transporter periplasmic adaptor subunit [Planctomycetota bacterium]